MKEILEIILDQMILNKKLNNHHDIMIGFVKDQSFDKAAETKKHIEKLSKKIISLDELKELKKKLIKN